jgi:hypothetical protein
VYQSFIQIQQKRILRGRLMMQIWRGTGGQKFNAPPIPIFTC